MSQYKNCLFIQLFCFNRYIEKVIYNLYQIENHNLMQIEILRMSILHSLESFRIISLINQLNI